MTEKKEEVALKPCPFCGGKVERACPPCSDLSEYIRHLTPATHCPVSFEAFTLSDGDEMVALWNTREGAPA